MSQPNLGKLVAFDLEATGLQAEKDRIVEFCFLELNDNFQPISRFHSLLCPGITMTDEVIAIHGLTNEALQKEPPFAHFAPRIQKLIDESTLIAHNCRLDLALLHYELVRAGQRGVSPNHPVIDTHAIETFVNGHNLGALYQRYYGQPLEGIHRAETDAKAAAAVLQGQLNHHENLLGKDPNSLLLEKIRLRNGSDGCIFLDHGRRFIKSPDGVIRINFGKLKGQPVTEHLDYLHWILKADFACDTKKVARDLLNSSR